MYLTKLVMLSVRTSLSLLATYWLVHLAIWLSRISIAATLCCLTVYACRGQRVIYTTPLKALSNQKLFEMRARFGTERVGLSTGDASITTDAPLMIMTTEILRNIMYRTAEEEDSDARVTKDSLNDVGLVVLDEVHPRHPI